MKHKIKFFWFFCIGLLCAKTYSQTIPTQSQIQIIRDTAIAYNFANPWPDPNTNCAGTSAYCLSSYTLNQNTSVADQYILNLPIDAFRDGSDCYFWNLSFVRIYADPILFQRLSSAAQSSLQDKMLNCLNYHSKMSYLNAGVWQIVGSENHNLVKKSTAYLISQKLMENPANHTMVLDDGFTLATHYNAYRTFFKSYFKEHARQGLNVEINSHTYVKYSLACYLNIYDLTTDDLVKRQAKNFLDLYTAENAVTYLKNANDVGGAATRQYKDSGIPKGKGKASYNAALGWSTSTISNHPTDVLVAYSSYYPSSIINTIAFADKPNFLAEFLSWGTKLTPLFTGVYNVGFNTQDKGDVVRFSYFTDSYAHGTTCYNPTQVFTAVAEQNRAMGITFNEPTVTRITVHGVGTAQGKETGYNEINGMSGTNCSVIWRNIDSRNNVGTRIYISNGDLINNKVEYNGWTFSETASAYVGYKVVQGSLSETSVTLGKMYTLSDMNSPIIIETAQKTDFSNFQAFKDAIVGNAIQTLSDGTIKYFSEANENFEVKPNSYVIPKKNNSAINFNLPNTFNSPYLNGMGDSYIATVSYPGFQDLKINFNDINIDLEAECLENPNWNLTSSSNVSANGAVSPNASIVNPFLEENILNFDFEIKHAGEYSIFARGLFPDGSSDSFFVSIDNGTYQTWHTGNAPNYKWSYLNLGNNNYTANFDVGYHRISIAKREFGAMLDKIRISENNNLPTEIGLEDTNCLNSIITHATVCSVLPNTNAATQFTSVGITTQSPLRMGWPNDVSNSFLTMESKNKGFVITRLTNTQVTTLTNKPEPNGALEGMLIYNTTEQKFQLYDGNSWKNIKLGCNN